MHRDTNGRACGSDRITALHARGVDTLPRLDGHIEMPGRVGDLAEQRQIGRGQEAVRVSLLEELERLLPIASGCCVTSAIDDAKSSAIAHRTPPRM